MNRNRQIEKVQPRTVAIQLIEAMYDLHGSAPAWLTSRTTTERAGRQGPSRALPQLRSDGNGNMRGMAERPRLLVLDLLETFAREQDMDVHLEGITNGTTGCAP
jgi:hypothetical protein